MGVEITARRPEFAATILLHRVWTRGIPEGYSTHDCRKSFASNSWYSARCWRTWRACSPAVPSTPRAPTSTVDRAEEATRTGDHAGAAALYERLAAQTTGSDSIEFRLRAARAWLAAGRAGGCRSCAGDDQRRRHPAAGPRTAPAAHPVGRGPGPWRRSLARGQRHAAAGRPRRPRRVITKPASRWPSPPATWSMASARSSRASGSSPPGRRARGAHRVARRSCAPRRNAACRSTPPPGSDATMRGWLEAASVAADNARNPTLGATRLTAFRNRYPSHPALAALADEPASASSRTPAAARSGAAPGADPAAHRAAPRRQPRRSATAS